MAWEPEIPGMWVDPKKMAVVLAEYEVGGTTFKIYGSQTRTFAEANRKLDDRQTLIQAYHFLTDDNRLALPFNACRAVVLDSIMTVWYGQLGFDIPGKTQSHMEQRMAKAKATSAEAEQAAAGTTEASTKEPRVTNRSIIEAGLLAGKDDETIMAEVKEHFPEGKADKKHIAYYRHYLVQDGKLEKQPRAPRAKKEKPVVEEAAAPAKVAAKAGTAKVATPPSVAKAAPAKAAGKAKAK